MLKIGILKFYGLFKFSDVFIKSSFSQMRFNMWGHIDTRWDLMSEQSDYSLLWLYKRNEDKHLEFVILLQVL